MTLILARASAEFVLQVTDRLVTLSSTKEPHDKVANKNILYFASNAVVTIAYTGHAYLDGIPTDHWIAQNLAGIKINPWDPPASLFGQNKYMKDVGLAFQILCNELNKQNQRNHFGLVLSIQGWQWNSKGILRPLVGVIKRTSNIYNIQYEPRNWYSEGAAMTIAAPFENISQEELIDLSNHLRHQSVAETENLLVDKIRELSQRYSVIGPHCISILLPPPSNPKILVRYLASDSLILPKEQKLTDDQLDWAYSPWIISPKMCLPPAQIVGGGFICTTGQFSIEFKSETSEHPKWLMAHQGQKRTRPPK